MEPELDRFWPRLNPVCENPRFQPPPALLKIEQLTFTTSGVSNPLHLLSKRSVSRGSEKQLDTNARPGSEGGNHSTLHELQSRSLQEYDAAPYRAAYADVLRRPGKLVLQIATLAPATPSRSQFQCPRKMIRRTSRCDPALRSIPRTPERRRLNSHD